MFQTVFSVLFFFFSFSYLGSIFNLYFVFYILYSHSDFIYLILSPFFCKFLKKFSLKFFNVFISKNLFFFIFILLVCLFCYIFQIFYMVLYSLFNFFPLSNYFSLFFIVFSFIFSSYLRLILYFLI